MDLNSVLEKINSLKLFIQDYEEEKESMKHKLASVFKKKKNLEDEQRSHFEKISELNQMINALQKSVSLLENHEAEKNLLSSEKIKLESHIVELEKVYEKQIEEFKKKMNEMAQCYSVKLDKELQQVKNKTSQQIEQYNIAVQEKNIYITQLEAEIFEIKSTENENLLKLKFEYEEKINRIKSQMSKNKGSCNSLSFQNDVFRQKYHKLEKESKEEVSQLKHEIEDLKLQISHLKYQNNTSTTCTENFLAHQTTEVNKNIMITQKNNLEKNQVLYEDEYAGRQKRFKPFESSEPSNWSDLNQCFMTQSELVKTVKKKLFNVELSYLDK